MASFANMTTTALAEQLNHAAEASQHRVDEAAMEPVTAPHETASRSTRAMGSTVYLPERVRAYRALLRGEHVPDWAKPPRRPRPIRLDSSMRSLFAVSSGKC